MSSSSPNDRRHELALVVVAIASWPNRYDFIFDVPPSLPCDQPLPPIRSTHCWRREWERARSPPPQHHRHAMWSSRSVSQSASSPDTSPGSGISRLLCSQVSLMLTSAHPHHSTRGLSTEPQSKERLQDMVSASVPDILAANPNHVGSGS
jgi:hypothetical protein